MASLSSFLSLLLTSLLILNYLQWLKGLCTELSKHRSQTVLQTGSCGGDPEPSALEESRPFAFEKNGAWKQKVFASFMLPIQPSGETPLRDQDTKKHSKGLPVISAFPGCLGKGYFPSCLSRRTVSF